MKSPQHMRIIQIDITNACVHACSNCTRFCGHHKKPYFMEFETFKRAVDSLEGYYGTIGMMGGEPTLHPEFERFARYLGEKFNGYGNKANHMILPQREFLKAIADREFENTELYDSGIGGRQTIFGAGLWSSIGKSYVKHYETIQDVFKYQALNDHSNKMLHQPILISRKELGISDEKWPELRDQCWVQNLWSASCTPKGAFFCEVAGTLDMLFDGPGGWPIEPGWWKRTPGEFGEQLNWCEYCGLACSDYTFARDANAEKDDVTPMLYEKLKEAKAINLQRYNVVTIENSRAISADDSVMEKFGGSMPYTESYEARYKEARKVLNEKSFVEITLTSNDEEKVIQSLEFSHQIAVPEDNMPDIARAVFSNNGFIVMHTANVKLKDDFCAKLNELSLNPGTLHFVDFSRLTETCDKYVENVGSINSGFLALFSTEAHSLRRIGFDGIKSLRKISEIRYLWNKEKIITFSDAMEYGSPETAIRGGVKYAVYGTGAVAEHAFSLINKNGATLVAIIDSNIHRQSDKFHDFTIQSPTWLKENAEEFDRIVVASQFSYYEMKEKIISLGISRNRITFLV